MVATDQLSLLFFVFIMFGLAYHAAKGLYTGEVRGGALFYRRMEQPIEFWWHVAYSAAGAFVLAWLLTHTGEQYSSRVFPTVALFWIAVPSAFWLLRGLQTGSSGLGKSLFDRRNAPLPYWAMLCFYAASAAIAVWATFSPSHPKDHSAFEEVVEPVVQAVRMELHMHPSLPFRDVRVDRQSGLVCGAVAPKEGTRRFYGNAMEGVGQAIVEGPGQDFQHRYAKFCSAPGYVPS